MGRLAIRKLIYNGKKYYYESPYLNDGLNIIVGDNGTGKSTFTNLIYFGLGGNVDSFNKNRSTDKHAEICEDVDNFLRLEIEINDKSYILLRYFYENEITVISEDGSSKNYKIFRRDYNEIFSDWILNELGIEVVELFQGNYNWKINFTDLFRLIYHDQSADPSNIYKKLDTNHFMSDSKMMRKAIFEILLGKSFTQYYKVLLDLKRKEKEKELKKEILKSFKEIKKTLNNSEEINLVYLEKELQNKEIQLNRLLQYREKLKTTNNTPAKTIKNIEKEKLEYLRLELKLSELKEREREVYKELQQLKKFKENSELEIRQIQKIIYTHQKLNIFSPDICPYCLNQVERQKNRCVCGSEINEDDYERFFYSTKDYIEILKSRQKSLESIDFAINDCEDEYLNIKKNIDQMQSELDKIQKNIIELSTDINEQYSFNRIRQIDDKILILKQEIQNIKQEISLEKRRDQLEKELQTLNNEYEKLRIEKKELEIQSQKEMLNIRTIFSEYYQKYMIDVLKSCRVASINDDYMPVINNGIYHEKSALVPIRLMYFLTLLKLSVEENVNYPKFLLIDTPQTAGIDDENLIKAISKIDDIFDIFNCSEKNKIDDNCSFQIILTTAKDKYPINYEKFVIENLTENNKLLKLK